MDEWRLYNHAIIPSVPPHKTPNLNDIENGKLLNGRGLFARWTSEFDCDTPTEWWYLIKDEPFDISQLKAKRRYEVNKGIKKFNCSAIKPEDYLQELFDVTVEAFSAYPKKYRPTVEKTIFLKTSKRAIKHFLRHLTSRPEKWRHMLLSENMKNMLPFRC